MCWVSALTTGGATLDSESECWSSPVKWETVKLKLHFHIWDIYICIITTDNYFNMLQWLFKLECLSPPSTELSPKPLSGSASSWASEACSASASSWLSSPSASLSSGGLDTGRPSFVPLNRKHVTNKRNFPQKQTHNIECFVRVHISWIAHKQMWSFYFVLFHALCNFMYVFTNH